MGGICEALKKYEDNRRGVRGVANHKGQMYNHKGQSARFFRYSKCSRGKRNQNFAKILVGGQYGGYM